MQVQELPTKIVSSAFELVRRPVTAVGDHLGPFAPDDVECWPPRLGIDALEGALKETVGSLFHDEHMAESGRTTRRAVERRRAAARTDATAEALAERADEELAERLDDVEAQRDAAVQRTATRKRTAARQGAAQVDAVRTRAERKERAVEEVAESAAETIERQGRTRRLEALDHEAAALNEERAAIDLAERARQLDEAIEHSKQQRKRT